MIKTGSIATVLAPVLFDRPLHGMQAGASQGNRLLEIRAAALARVCEPGAQEQFTKLRRERRRRTRRIWQPGVVKWDATDLKYSPLAPAPGSLTLYWATSGSDVISALRSAFLKQDLKELEKVHAEISPAIMKRTVRSLDETVDSLLAAPSFFDVRYSGSTLAQYLWLADSPLGSMTFPYNGGPFDSDRLSIVEYCPDPRPPKPPRKGPPPPPPPWDVLFVLREPRLSALERRVLNAVPASISEIHLGPSGTVAATPAALITIAVFVAVNTAVTTCCAPFFDRLSQIAADDIIQRAATPDLAAAELLDLRAMVFDEFGVM